jgi:hypothetical protein
MFLVYVAAAGAILVLYVVGAYLFSDSFWREYRANLARDTSDLVYRLRKRAEIRRQISTRKSVQEGKRDRIADLLEEAATEIERLRSPH